MRLFVFYINISCVSAKACFCFLSFISIFAIFVILEPLTVFFKNLTYCAQRTCMIIVINAVTIEQLHVETSYRGYVWACANLAIPWCWFQAFLQLVTKWEKKVGLKETNNILMLSCCSLQKLKISEFFEMEQQFLSVFLDPNTSGAVECECIFCPFPNS